MNKKGLFGLLLLISFAFCNPILADSNLLYLGEPTFGARALAMGGLAAGSRDISSVYWNPADIVEINRLSFIFGRDYKFNLNNWYEDQVGFVLPSKGKFGIGGFLIKDAASLNSGRSGQSISSPWATQLLGLSVAVRLSPGFNLGTSLMQLGFNGVIDDVEENSQAILSNIGVTIKRNNFSVGLVAHNLKLHGELKVEEDYHLGLAWENNEARVQAELISYIPPEKDHREWSLGGGVEFVFMPGLSFRIGRSQMRLDDPGYLTTGFGASLGRWIIDYSYAPHGLGATHYLSTGLQF